MATGYGFGSVEETSWREDKEEFSPPLLFSALPPFNTVQEPQEPTCRLEIF